MDLPASGTWNGARQLTSYNNATASMSAATYDGDGLRATSTTTSGEGPQSTQAFVWETKAPLLLMDSANAYIYSASGAPAEQVNLSSGTVTYLNTDLLGSVRGIIGSTGSLAATGSYDAWGNPQVAGSTSAYTPFGFAGSYTDPDGLLYLINRYYDPGTGQFLSVDPEVSQTDAPYTYASGDPVTEADPTGLASIEFNNPAGCIAEIGNAHWQDGNPETENVKVNAGVIHCAWKTHYAYVSVALFKEGFLGDFHFQTSTSVNSNNGSGRWTRSKKGYDFWDKNTIKRCTYRAGVSTKFYGVMAAEVEEFGVFYTTPEFPEQSVRSGSDFTAHNCWTSG